MNKYETGTNTIDIYIIKIQHSNKKARYFKIAFLKNLVGRTVVVPQKKSKDDEMKIVQKIQGEDGRPSVVS